MTDFDRWGGPTATGGTMNTRINTAETVLNNGSNPGLLWTYLTGGKVRTCPIVVGANLYAGSDDKKMHAVVTATGLSLGGAWPYVTGDKVRSTPQVAGGVCYFGSDDGFFYAINSTTAALVWKGPVIGGVSTNIGAKVRSSPVVSGTKVIFGADNGKVYALNTADGTIAWTFDTAGGSVAAMEGALAVYNANVYAASLNGNVYCVTVAGGTLVRTFKSRGAATAPALATDGAGVTHLIFGSADHYLYDYDADTGKKIWAQRQSGDLLAPVAIDITSGYVMVGKHQWRIEAIGLYTSKDRWVKDGTASSAVITAAIITRNGGGDTHPLAWNAWPISTTGGNGDGRLGMWEVINAPGGQNPIWKYPSQPASTNPFGQSDPCVVNGKIYIGGDDFNVYAWG